MKTTLWIPLLSVACLAAGASAQPSITVTPSSGGLGTVMQINLSPQDLGYQMSDLYTTATWTGVYQPMAGSPSAQFAIDYSEAEVIVESPWIAKVILGTGTVTNGPDLLSLGAPGSLVGTLQVDIPFCRADVTHPVSQGMPGYGEPDGQVTAADIQYYVNLWVALDPQADLTTPNAPAGDPNYGVPDGSVTGADIQYYVNTYGAGVCPAHPIAVSDASTVSISGDTGQWSEVVYPSGFFGLDPPQLGGALTQLEVFRVSTLPDPSALSEQVLLGVSGAHAAAVVLVEENASTSSASAPIIVDLVALNAGNLEIDRVSGVALAPILNDGDPNFVTYANDLSIPIVVVDSVLNKSLYPNVLLLYAPAGSTCTMVPSP